MILRRLTQHIKDQNWFAVLLDFFIVVVGILIAFQITNWSAQLTLRGQEAGVMQSIADDLRNDERQLLEGIDTAVINIQAANFALHAASRPVADNVTFLVDSSDTIGNLLTAPSWQELDPKLTNKLWQLSVSRFYPVQSNSAFGSLVASGNLGLLQNQDLIRQLQIYQRRWSDIEVSQNLTYRPFRNQTAFVGQKFGLSMFTDIPQEQLVSLLSDNPELEGALRNLSEYSIIHHAQLVEAIKVTRELLVYLGKTTP
jgi:hypothetical protein